MRERLLSFVVILLITSAAWAEAKAQLPNAPVSHVRMPLLAGAAPAATAAPTAGQTNSQAPAQAGAAVPPTAQTASTPAPPGQVVPPSGRLYPRLTLSEAEALAIKNNPQITVGRLLSLASQQVTRRPRAP